MWYSIINPREKRKKKMKKRFKAFFTFILCCIVYEISAFIVCKIFNYPFTASLIVIVYSTSWMAKKIIKKFIKKEKQGE